MKKKDVQIGKIYRVKGVVGGCVKIISESQYGGYNAINPKTNRSIRIKSAAKLRYPVKLKEKHEYNSY